MASVPKVVDLFSGCGGLSLGFRANGFQFGYGMELIPEAVSTIAKNITTKYGDPNVHICNDITKVNPEDIERTWGDEGCMVIGGPPCQAYSLAGRAKLSSLGEHRRNTSDSRGYLFMDYLRFIDSLDPKIVVMENVIESTNFGGMNVPEIVCSHLEKAGYDAKWTILNSADYGVPQVRERMILLAAKRELGIELNYPTPTHFSEDDMNLTRARRQESKFKMDCPHYVPAPRNDKGSPWVTVGEALGDLPVLFPSERSKYILYPMSMALPYKTGATNSFQLKMRNWFGEEETTVTGNAFRKTLRDFPIFARMKPGDNYIDASRIADELLAKRAKETGISIYDEDKMSLLRKKIVPPYDRNNFVGKWQKLDPDKPSHTLVAHLSVDTYSHIHPWEPRGISVREAARLQSFPDGFLFPDDLANAYKEIGNAVPPLLSFAIAEELRKELSNAKC